MNKIIWLVKKDIKMALRIGKLYIITGSLLPLVLLAAPFYVQIKYLEDINKIEFVSSYIINYIPFIILYIMLFVGISIIQKIITREKSNKTMIPLLCSGVTPEDYWWSKLFSIFLLTISISIIYLLILLIIISLLTPGLVVSRLSALLIQVFITPLFSLVFIGITILLYMISLNFWLFSIICMILPVMLLPYWNKIIILNNYYILGAGLLCILLIIAMGNLVNCISRERLSGIFEMI